MSSTYPTSSVSALVGLGVVGCDSEKSQRHAASQEVKAAQPTGDCTGITDSSDPTYAPLDSATTIDPDTAPKAVDLQSVGNSESGHVVSTTDCDPAPPASSQSGDDGANCFAPDSESPLPAPAYDLHGSGCDEGGDQREEVAHYSFDDFDAELEKGCAETSAPTSLPKVFHRAAIVRQTQGLTERTVAKRMGIDIRTYRQLECATTDLTLSQLAALQRALEVPMVELLEDTESLSRPVQERAQMVKVMKTAVAMREAGFCGRMGRLANMLCQQLVDVMPELKEVGGWPQFGARRGQSAVGRALAQPIDTSELRADR